jgi:hypothetical protein
MLVPLLFAPLYHSQPIIAAPPEQAMIPRVTIALHDENKTAHVGPGDPCYVMFNGTVSVIFSSASSIEVTIGSIDDFGYSDISPETFVFSTSGEESFTVIFLVKPGESCKNNGSVTIIGYWRWYHSSIIHMASPEEGITRSIDIAQYFEFFLSGMTGTTRMLPGEEEKFNLAITNKGNGDDVVVAEIINQEELTNKGFEVSLSESRLELPEHGTVNVKITIRTPSGIGSIGHHDMKIRVSSEKGLSENEPPKTITFDIDIPEDSITSTTEFYFIIVIVLVVIVLSIILFWRRRRKRRRLKI